MASMDWSVQGGAGPEVYQAVLVPAMFAPFAEVVADAAGVQPGERVLDVACGTGALSRVLARRAGADGAITGVDLGEPMLQVARAQPVEDGAAPIEYLAGTAEAPPVPVGAFDAVTCQQGLQFFPDRGAALAAMRAALRPGGRVAVATWTDLDGATVLAATARALEEHIGPDAGAMMRSPFGLADALELTQLLDDAGFADVEVTKRTRPVHFAQRSGLGRRVIAAGPVEAAFVAADDEAQERTLAAIAAALADVPGGEQVHIEMTSNIGVARAVG